MNWISLDCDYNESAWIGLYYLSALSWHFVVIWRFINKTELNWTAACLVVESSSDHRNNLMKKSIENTNTNDLQTFCGVKILKCACVNRVGGQTVSVLMQNPPGEWDSSPWRRRHTAQNAALLSSIALRVYNREGNSFSSVLTLLNLPSFPLVQLKRIFSRERVKNVSAHIWI